MLNGAPPYVDDDVQRLLTRIASTNESAPSLPSNCGTPVRCSLEFRNDSQHCAQDARAFVAALLHKTPSARLGCRLSAAGEAGSTCVCCDVVGPHRLISTGSLSHAGAQRRARVCDSMRG